MQNEACFVVDIWIPYLFFLIVADENVLGAGTCEELWSLY